MDVSSLLSVGQVQKVRPPKEKAAVEETSFLPDMGDYGDDLGDVPVRLCLFGLKDQMQQDASMSVDVPSQPMDQREADAAAADAENAEEEEANENEVDYMGERTRKMVAMLQKTFSKSRSSTADFNKVIAGQSRTTAAICFFEILKLKTKGFVEVEQESAYGAIKVTKTVIRLCLEGLTMQPEFSTVVSAA
jgi:chromatin segregation and condensation protein Rec8/ScpA/Scc1 (kleisin family)